MVADDTSWEGLQWKGKGAPAVPYLIGKGWKVAAGSGYQTILTRS